MLDIVRHIEGDIHLLDCEKMGLGEGCVIGDIFDDIAIQMSSQMSQIKVTDIMKRMEEKEKAIAELDWIVNNTRGAFRERAERLLKDLDT